MCWQLMVRTGVRKEHVPFLGNRMNFSLGSAPDRAYVASRDYRLANWTTMIRQPGKETCWLSPCIHCRDVIGYFNLCSSDR